MDSSAPRIHTPPFAYAVASFLYAASIPFESAAFNTVLPVTYLASLLLAACGLHAGFTRPALILPKWALTLPPLFLAWNCATYWWSPDSDATLTRVGTLTLILVTVVALTLTADRRSTYSAINGLIAGGLAASFYVRTSYQSRDATGEIRISALGANANDLGGQLAIAAIASLAVAFAMSPEKQLRRTMYFAAGLGIAFSALSTGSRTALIALLTGTMVTLLVQRKASFSRLFAISVGIVAVGWLAYKALDQRILDRLGSTGDSVAIGDLNSRVDTWKLAIGLTRQNPLFGWGSGSSTEVLQQGGSGLAVTHSTWIGTALELGFIGLIVLLALFVLPMRTTWKSPYRWTLTPLFAVLIVMGTTLSWEYRKILWLVIGIGLSACISHINSQGVRQDASHPVGKFSTPSRGRDQIQ